MNLAPILAFDLNGEYKHVGKQQGCKLATAYFASTIQFGLLPLFLSDPC